MFNTIKYLLLISVLLAGISCTKISEVNVEENPLLFFWQEMDKRYVYFSEKKLNWDSVRNTLSFYNPDNRSELLSGFKSMIQTVNDSHVWVKSDNEVIAPILNDFYNFISIELERYSPSNILTTDYYRVAQLANSVLFIEVKHFGKSFNGFENILKKYQYQNGIIIDVKSCGGGYLDFVLDLSSCFIEGEHTVLYNKFKKGHGHNDFTDYHALKLKGGNAVSNVDILLITDRATYSGANAFVSIMKNFAGAVQIGNRTGGGGASSVIGVLPNGWIYSISENQYFDINYNSLEWGIAPEHYVEFGVDEFDAYRNTRIHSQIEYAFNLLNN